MGGMLVIYTNSLSLHMSFAILCHIVCLHCGAFTESLCTLICAIRLPSRLGSLYTHANYLSSKTRLPKIRYSYELQTLLGKLLRP